MVRLRLGENDGRGSRDRKAGGVWTNEAARNPRMFLHLVLPPPWFLDLRILKELTMEIAEVRIVKDLERKSVNSG
jgi:hypothetical protein